ncbi:hypothetical protein [Pseudonocardia sp. ICBG1293]|uniref:hypothetical protein n=1 Tax=Pseudonocardia sp. ICBG1293 TaxID=2844382 RepID=UPI001CCF64F6|nr:hypothetical protein [Pseudonocardia sp. ICBG1293]
MVTGRGATGTQRDDDAGDTAVRTDGPAGGAGVADRLGRSGDDASPPVFGTAPWGYRRAEVDAWASWVARLVEQGRRETVRADSAEATLHATLRRLDELERGAGAPSATVAPAAVTGADATQPPDRGSSPATVADRPASADGPGPATATGDTPAPLPRRRPGAAGAPVPPGTEEGQRLRVVETTLGEVMVLLQRLAR